MFGYGLNSTLQRHWRWENRSVKNATGILSGTGFFSMSHFRTHFHFNPVAPTTLGNSALFSRQSRLSQNPYWKVSTCRRFDRVHAKSGAIECHFHWSVATLQVGTLLVLYHWIAHYLYQFDDAGTKWHICQELTWMLVIASRSDKRSLDQLVFAFPDFDWTHLLDIWHHLLSLEVHLPRRMGISRKEDELAWQVFAYCNGEPCPQVCPLLDDGGCVIVGHVDLVPHPGAPGRLAWVSNPEQVLPYQIDQSSVWRGDDGNIVELARVGVVLCSSSTSLLRLLANGLFVYHACVDPSVELHVGLWFPWFFLDVVRLSARQRSLPKST